ncbi:hypothetical protein [Methylocystis echinoides]|uniref:hypothetical protein n=1 Tax=Methylocystis echinoides TaxID=29468 RepID=UPI003429C5BC
MAESQRAEYFATVEETVTPEEVLKPDFWRHVATTLRPYDLIDVAVDSCDWFMRLLVADAWHNGVRVIELSRHDMTGEAEEAQSIGNDLRVKWRGPVNKWAVVRSDGVILRANLPDKNIALEALAAAVSDRAKIGF